MGVVLVLQPRRFEHLGIRHERINHIMLGVVGLASKDFYHAPNLVRSTSMTLACAGRNALGSVMTP